MTIDEKLDEILARLARIEERQITVKGEIESSAATQPVGSFGSTESPEEPK